MISHLIALSLSLLSPVAQASASQPSYDVVAESVAEITTNVCFRLETGDLRWTPKDLQEEISQIEAAGLTYGVPHGVIDTLGPTGQASVNRATLASRTLEDFVAVMALNGRIPGCRVMLAGHDHPGMADAVADELVKAGWLALPDFTSKSDTFEQRLFVRSEGNQWYKLDLAYGRDAATRLRMLVAVSSVSRPNQYPLGTLPK